MKSLQCNFSENVLYYQGILKIGRLIFQDFYRIPGDNELVASVNDIVQISNQNISISAIETEEGCKLSCLCYMSRRKNKNPRTLVVQITFITRG